MYVRNIALIVFTIFCFSACKKGPAPAPEIDLPNVSYKVINKKLHASHVEPMNLDVNGDGTIDFSYFMQYVVLDGNVNLYTGVNPVFGGATSAGVPNDNEFLNMGGIHSFAIKNVIKASTDWTSDHAFLANRRESPTGNRTYLGDWGSGQEKIMALRFQSQGNAHYGWARLRFDKVTEELILIDVAWNTIAEQQIEAGAR